MDKKREYCLQLKASGIYPDAPACRVEERLRQCLVYVLQVGGGCWSLCLTGRAVAGALGQPCASLISRSCCSGPG